MWSGDELSSEVQLSDHFTAIIWESDGQKARRLLINYKIILSKLKINENV